MLKRELRKKYKELRKAFSVQEVDKLSNKCFKILIENFDFKNKNVGLFLPIPYSNEPNIFLLFPNLDLTITKVYAPVSNKETFEMEFYQIDMIQDLKEGMYGIPEPPKKHMIHPEELDIILLPLLAFNQDGQRIGYGKGYYDRFLNKTKKEIIKIGISLFDQIEKFDEIDPNDVPMTFCITPERCINFKL